MFQYWPFPPGIGEQIRNHLVTVVLMELIGLVVEAIVESIKHDQADIDDLNREIAALNLAQNQVTAALTISTPCHDLTTALSQGWSTLTTQTQQLQTFEQIFEENPSRDATFRPLVQASWKTLSDSLSKW